MPKLPLAKEGITLIASLLVTAMILAFLPHIFFRTLSFILVLMGIFCAYFFRDPARNLPGDNSSFVLAPGDGRILEISHDPNDNCGENTTIIKIFLSVFDVHVQRSPIAGVISKVDYKKGTFYDARDPRASSRNEQNSIVVEGEKYKVDVKQIAGLIARRIICYVKRGQTVVSGQRLGLIKFGSQVDILVPHDAEICVKKDDIVLGGISPLAINRQSFMKKQEVVLQKNIETEEEKKRKQAEEENNVNLGEKTQELHINEMSQELKIMDSLLNNSNDKKEKKS